MKRAIIALLIFWLLLSACETDKADRGANGGRRPVIIGDDGYFHINGEPTRILGVEFYPTEKAILQKSIPLIKELGCNFVFFYPNGWEDRRDEGHYKLLADNGLMAAQMVSIAKMGDGTGEFAMTGGGVGVLPDEPFILEQLDLIAEMVAAFSVNENVLFWLIGGEFVSDEMLADGGRALRDVVQRMTDEIRAHDPLGRPVTVAHHIMEAVLFDEDSFVDFSDIVDFTWFTIATHLHDGDLNAESEEPWAPSLAIEEPKALAGFVNKAYRLNHGMPIYLASWYTNAIAPVCAPSYDATMEKWNTITSAAPFLGAAFWPFIHWLDDSPHTLAVIEENGDESNLITNESFDAVKEAYTTTGWDLEGLR